MLSKTTEIEAQNSETPYKLVYEVVYPSLKDEKILQDVLLNEVIFTAESVRKRLMNNCSDDKGQEAENWKQNERRSLPPEVVEFPKAGFRPNNSVRLEVSRIGDKLHIPLIKLFCVPKVQQLSGSLQRLQEILQGSDRVSLSSCSSSILYPAYDDNSED
ncbi:small RNA 2'-O-methyltransferase-like [Heptranchias perlo]|uniref:small RNA 2'-O-methyltransferase-like n=1 Tax=Heptranchias perlo TaxID=212740 RepID=UPI003559AA9B